MQLMEHRIGLYVTLENDGNIKRNLITESGEQELPVTTIKDEIIAFSESNFGPYSKLVDIIEEIANNIKTEGKRRLNKNDVKNYEHLTALVDGIINELKENSPIASLLSATAIADNLPAPDDSIEYLEIVKFVIPKILRSIVDFNLFVNDTFYNIYIDNPLDEEGEHYFLS